MKRQLLFLWMCLLLGASNVFAQTVLTGTVIDGTSKQTMPGVTVVAKGLVAGTITNVDGNFTLKLRGALPVTLQFSMVGYKTGEAIITENKPIRVELAEGVGLLTDVIVTGNRVEERITKSPVTVEQIGVRQIQNAAAFDLYSNLQSVKGVDLLTQNMIFRSVNVRGFGANNNNRFVQLTDGMDNRSPGLGFGFGSTAGVSDLDVETIEILPGASSALYGPDALQGLMLTKTKSPYDYQGISAQVKTGVNNVGKDGGAKPYTDFALRFAKRLNDRAAFKVSAQMINGTDFVADNFDDRMTRARAGFFATDAVAKTVKLGYVPNNDPKTNFQYDGVNIYGDDVSNGGGVNFTTGALAGKLVTRTGYSEVDLLDNQGKIFSNRVNAALHYKLTDRTEANVSYFFGNGNLVRTAGFREYFPDYKRHQVKVEFRGDNYFLRGYNTSQEAEGYNLGVLAQRILQAWKPTATWGADFATAYAANGGNLANARATADTGKPLPGTQAYNALRDPLINTLNNATAITLANGTKINGVRLLDNSSMRHVEGMYDFKKMLPSNIELITGASMRKYSMLTQGTIFPATASGEEFTITEYGWYAQGAVTMKLGDNASIKPIAAVRYDKNEYFEGGFTPRVSAVITVGDHNIRASWQSAFRNPSPNQLLADGKIGEVGGSQTALEAANLFANPAYTEASVLKYRASGLESDLVKYVPDPSAFTTEKINSWEIGYKALINEQFYIDAMLYRSTYNDFIATQNYVQPANSNVADLKNTATSKTYQVNFNNFNEIYVNGWGVGLEYLFRKGTSLSGNFANQIGLITLKDNAGVTRKDPFGEEIVKRKMSNLEVSAVGRNFFISPENRYNITLANPRVTRTLGFQVTYRWTDEMWVEQGNTQGDILLPEWNTIDAAISYKVPSLKTVIKLGGTNLANKYYAQGYGLARIGGMYYVSFNFDDFLNR